jgi:hypothetical protein
MMAKAANKTEVVEVLGEYMKKDLLWRNRGGMMKAYSTKKSIFNSLPLYVFKEVIKYA